MFNNAFEVERRFMCPEECGTEVITFSKVQIRCKKCAKKLKNERAKEAARKK